jgi:hypothetical protein
VSAQLHAVPDDPQTIDPCQEIREGIEVLNRLATNPVLSPHAADAVPMMRGFLTRSLEAQGVRSPCGR